MNFPDGMTARDWRHVEGADLEDDASVCVCGHERDDHRSGRGYCHRCPGDGGPRPRDCRAFTEAEVAA